MASSVSKYPYRPLDIGKQEIRLLQLDGIPASDQDNPDIKIQCRLTYASFDSTPHYAALSYVWGDASDTMDILLDGHRVSVTRNLHEALARLQLDLYIERYRQLERNTDDPSVAEKLKSINQHAESGEKGKIPTILNTATISPLVLWVDALCINQSDHREKASQVRLMGQIYANANLVYVWIGNDCSDGLTALEALSQCFQGVKDSITSNEVPYAAIAETIRQLSWDRSQTDKSQGRHFDFEAIARLICLPWWRRVWIIQEVVLAKRAQVLCDKAQTVRWEDIYNGFEAIECLVDYPSVAHQYHRLYVIVAEIYRCVKHLNRATVAYKELREDQMVSRSNNTGLLSLQGVIWWTWGNYIQATDSRDRVYGLLGMVREDEASKITVDYSTSMTLSKVLVEVAKLLIEQNGPDILTHCRTTALSSSLPSWVPDWTAPQMAAIGGNSEFKACGELSTLGATGSVQSRYEDSALILKGSIVGRIVAVGSPFRTEVTHPTYINDCRNWLQEMEDLVQSSEELWRIPIADTGINGRISAEDSSRYKHCYNVFMGRKEWPALDYEVETDWIEAESWNYRRVWKAYQRRIFIDDAGRPGLAPESVCVGDMIAVFANGSIPFIIRETKRTVDQGAASANVVLYQLIGSAYTGGLMDGEATESKDTSFEEIHII